MRLRLLLYLRIYLWDIEYKIYEPAILTIQKITVFQKKFNLFIYHFITWQLFEIFIYKQKICNNKIFDDEVFYNSMVNHGEDVSNSLQKNNFFVLIFLSNIFRIFFEHNLYWNKIFVRLIFKIQCCNMWCIQNCNNIFQPVSRLHKLNML